MTPAARVAAAIDILGLVEALDRPADRIVEHWFRSHRFAGAKDRAAINAIVYGVLRHRAELAWKISQILDARAVGPRSLVIANLAEGIDQDSSNVRSLFDASRYGPAPLEDDEQSLISEMTEPAKSFSDIPNWVRVNCPEWLFGELSGSLGQSVMSEMSALQQRAPLDLRANSLKAARQDAQSALASEGVEAELCPIATTGLRVLERASIRDTRAFREGIVEIQDEGSQLASLLVDARPGHSVVDLCAGAGGKSLALAASMTNDGLIHAWDISNSRLKRMRERLERAGATIVKSHHISGMDDPWIDRFAGQADRVLVDAPCTGTGTIRRNPDLPWRLSPDDTVRYASLQQQLLARAATLVATGGRLIYVTCSLLEAENALSVSNFLDAHRNFRTVAIDSLWSTILKKDPSETGNFILLTPARYGTDGYFIAVLERGE